MCSLLVVSSVLALSLTVGAATYTKLPGLDCPGNDLGNELRVAKNSDLSECEEHCSNLPTCVGFAALTHQLETLGTIERRCVFKTKCTRNGEKESGASNLHIREFEYGPLYNGHKVCPGNTYDVIKNVITSDLSKCFLECSRRIDCAGFIFAYGWQNECRLKKKLKNCKDGHNMASYYKVGPA